LIDSGASKAEFKDDLDAAQVGVHTFSTLASLESNVDALESGLLFANGMLARAAIVGPTGCGKTHLLDAIEARARQRGNQVERCSFHRYLPDDVRYDVPGMLMLDDVHQILGRRRRARLRTHLEQRVAEGKPTFLSFTGSEVTRAIHALIPSLASWRLATIEPPLPAQRVAILDQMSGARGMRLSPQLATIISHRLCGNGHTLLGALNRLKLYGEVWAGPQMTLHACGLLDPLFLDNGEWDLARNIIAIAKENRPFLRGASWQELSLYTLLHICELGEMEVARAMDLEPAAVYTRANVFRRGMSGSSESAECVSKFTELVVSKLAGQ
jgi:hypothetical protein